MRTIRARTGLAVAAATGIVALVVLLASWAQPEAAASAAVVAVLGLSYLVRRRARAVLIYDRERSARQTDFARRERE